METVTDYKSWLDEEGFDSAEDLLQIYRPVNDGEKGWSYEMQPITVGAPGRFLVTGGERNLILTEKSRVCFIRYMDSLYELGVEGQAIFEHAMSKDD